MPEIRADPLQGYGCAPRCKCGHNQASEEVPDPVEERWHRFRVELVN
jgi:hypothetical protein